MFGGRKVRSNKGIKRGTYGSQTKHRKTRSNKGIKRGKYSPRIIRKKKRSNRGVKRGSYVSKKINIKNEEVNRNRNNNNSCKIIDVNGTYQLLNNEYPGDEWVHEHLMENRDIDLKYYQKYHPEKITESYHKYLNICKN
jgi:hypothetical protein